MIVNPMLSSRLKKDGTQNIVIYLYDSRIKQRAYIKTDQYVNEQYWVGSVKKGYPAYQYINAKVETIALQIKTYWLKNDHLIPSQVKEWYLGPKIKYGPVKYYEHYLEMCRTGKILKKYTKTRVSYNYIKALKTSFNYLEAYSKKIPVTFEIINEDWYNKFVAFMRQDINLKQNTIAKAIKHLKIICAHAKKNKIHSSEDFKDYHISTEKSQKIWLTPNEIDRVLNVNLKEYPELKPEQDRFAVAYNLLLRFGDSVSIRENNIIKRDGRYYLNTFTQKTKKEVTLPIKESVYEILRRNNFVVKGINARSNKNLKKLGMLAGINDNFTITEFEHGVKTETVFKKYQLIETHTTRRSAARNLYEAGMDPEIIRVLGGWSTLKQMFGYIGIDLDYAANKAADHPFFK
jgi:integrase